MTSTSSRIARRRRNSEGAELLEFALALPLILVMLVGLLDFAHAYHLKQALANAARAGARLGGTEDTKDLTNPTSCGGVPCSVENIRNEVISYLQNAGINTSFIGTTGTYNTATDTATYYTTAGATGSSYGLEINRSFVVVDSGGTSIPSTQVSLYYPYDWTFGFNYIVKLLIPSATFTGPITIGTDATMANP